MRVAPEQTVYRSIVFARIVYIEVSRHKRRKRCIDSRGRILIESMDDGFGKVLSELKRWSAFRPKNRVFSASILSPSIWLRVSAFPGQD